ncbi:MAG: V-type ATP synthase subunit F [Clostridiales bacterium]|nr:V-type ATP synthase subunit F [Clostridiales bacterium]
MKSFLISDNKDTWIGMRLAGIDGVIVHTREEVLNAIKDAMKNDEIGIIILTELAVDQVRAEVMDLKLKCKTPLLIEIPDRHGSHHSHDMIKDYIRDAVGIHI